MERVSLKPYILMLALSAGFLAWMHFTWAVNLAPELPVALELPDQLGPWQGHVLRFCHNPDCGGRFNLCDLDDPDRCPQCGEKLYSMRADEMALLPADTEMIKGEYQDAHNTTILVTIVLSGYERASIHRPEVCLTGGGHILLHADYKTIQVKDTPPLRVKVLTLEPPSGGRPWQYVYWFIGTKHHTSSHLTRYFWVAWDRILKNEANRWAYISVAGGNPGSSDNTERLLKFSAALNAWVERSRETP